MGLRKDPDNPELPNESLAGEQISHLGERCKVPPSNIRVIPRQLAGAVGQRSGPRKKWLRQKHSLPVAAD